MVTAALLLACLPMFGFVLHPTADYKLIQVQGHPEYLSPECAPDAALLDRAVARLASDLAAIHGVLPKAALTGLAEVAFCIEHENLKNVLAWHKEQPFLVLHEMSHAYHHQVLGFDHATVRQAFDLAASNHRYDSAPYVKGGSQRAYAVNNHKEYLAELSEAYWGRNDFYPFVGSELEKFDPAGFHMIEKLWLGR